MDKLMPVAPDGLQVKQNSGGKASNTGPKGVKADYELAKANLGKKRMMERVRREREVDRLANGARDLRAIVAQVESARREGNKPATTAATAKGNDDDEEEEEEEDDDDDLRAFEEYKSLRIKSIQNSLPRYGDYKRVSFSELAKLIKEENEFVSLVAHLYQNHIESCAYLHVALERLAPHFPHVHFVRIRSREAMANYSDIGLPTLLVYKSQKLAHSFIRVADMLGGEKAVTEVSVAKFLAEHGILRLPSGNDDAVIKQRQERLKGGPTATPAAAGAIATAASSSSESATKTVVHIAAANRDEDNDD